MLNTLIRFSLQNRGLILIVASAMMAYGLWVGAQLPVDVFPDLNRPTVTILTEAHGLAPEEVETLVSIPLESAMHGIPGATRIRSSSGIGISIVHVEFEWKSDIYRNRQFVFERMQQVARLLPKGMTPSMGPITSIMGEIQFIGVVSEDKNISPADLRTLADWTLRPRIMSLPGISQVIVMGGDVKEYQVFASTERLHQKGLSLGDFQQALSKISDNTTGGFMDIDSQEFLIRPMGRVQSLEDIQDSVVGIHLGKPVLVKEVATVRIGAKTKRGESSINGNPAVVMTIQKQPDADTLALTKQIDALIKDISNTLPQGIAVQTDLFKQSRFIEAANHNVVQALRDGAIIVAIVLFVFLMSVRTTAITLVTIPLSLLLSAIVFHVLGLGINTMTLGGFAIAMGELVDDAIVDVENVFRRLRENASNEHPKSHLRVIFEASSEVRNSIIFSTFTVIMVFLPLFFLSGIEGRLFAPLGLAYIISLLASLLVSLTVTPVLCSFLLKKAPGRHQDNRLIQLLKGTQRRILLKTLDHPYALIIGCALLLALSLSLLPFMGRNFLPPFNEGTATIGIAANPGISLTASDQLGRDIEHAILSVPEVKSTVRRTGRAEMDEHAEGVHWSEIDVDFKEGGRERTTVLQDIRDKIAATQEDVYINIGQPISHRLDHLLSGVRAQIAVKIFGPDLTELRRIGVDIESLMQKIPGIVDLTLEPMVPIPQLKIAIDREAAREKGIAPGALAEDLESLLNGETVGQVIDRQYFFNIIMKSDAISRETPTTLENLVIKTMPNGQYLRLSDVAEVYQGEGPNVVNRENSQRRLILSANTQGRNLGRLVTDLKTQLAAKIQLPEGYTLSLEGQFENQQRASRSILIMGIISLLGIVALLYRQFQSMILVLQIMLNIPLALIGSIVAIYLTQRELSVATLIAFITLCGIASRNGIMMISHYLHLVHHEGEAFSKEMVLRGSAERLVPVLMTALTAALALVPLLLSHGEPGKEILYPVAVVIVGGLISSTLLDLVLTPTVFYHFGRKATEKHLQHTAEKERETLL